RHGGQADQGVRGEDPAAMTGRTNRLRSGGRGGPPALGASEGDRQSFAPTHRIGAPKRTLSVLSARGGRTFGDSCRGASERGGGRTSTHARAAHPTTEQTHDSLWHPG